MNVVILGSGAMGCRFGVALQKAGAEVHLYDIWKEHIAGIQEKGLKVTDGEGGEEVIKMQATDNIADLPVADVLIIFTKSLYSADALAAAKSIIGENTVAVTLQNGLGNVETIQKYAGDKIIAGVTNYASDLLRPGCVELKGSGVTKMMALNEGAQPTAQRLAQMLNASGHNCVLSGDVFVDIWEKVAFNAALNTVTAITGLTVGQVGTTPESNRLIFRIAEEVVRVANACGVKADLAHVKGVINSVFDPKMSGDHKTSMLQDVILKRKTEIDSICGYVLKEAEKAAIDTPYLESVTALVKTIEANYR